MQEIKSPSYYFASRSQDMHVFLISRTEFVLALPRSQMSTYDTCQIFSSFGRWFRERYYYVYVLVRIVFLPRSTLECSDILLAAMSEYLA